jgi:hypothetical protein
MGHESRKCSRDSGGWPLRATTTLNNILNSKETREVPQVRFAYLGLGFDVLALISLQENVFD